MKKSGNAFLAVIILAVVGGVFLFQSVPEWITSIKQPVDASEIVEEQVKAGTHVQGEIFAIVDSFASEQTWTENGDGSRTAKKTSNVYYIIPVGEQSYIGVECPASNKSSYDTLCDATWEWLSGETEYINADSIEFEGRIVKMEDELYQYMVEWFQDMEYFGDAGEEEIKTYVLPYMYKPFSPGLYALLAIGGGFVAIAVIVLIVAINQQKKRKKRAEELANAPAPVYDPAQESADALSHLQQ